ncbi:MAG: sigma-70 family RNA polymerase sigma factor [Pirellulales bacterium]
MEIDTQPAATRTAPIAVFATDGELLMRFERHRDEQAFAEVIERHGRLVWIVCQQSLRHHQDVEDAFQATFLILAQRATTIRASDSAAAWLYRVAQRTAIAARRRRSRRREESLTAEPPQGEEALPVIHDRQMLYVLMEELRALPERYQTPLVLRYFEGQSRRAIAEQTDSTLAQIQGRLVRGRRMLRSRLIRRGVSLSLATGVVSTASTTASAAVSPSLVAATAACSCSFITSGATGGASPAAVELSKQGLNAMWYASVTKVATVAATLIVGLGVAWGAGQPGTSDGVAAAVQVDLGQSAELSASDPEEGEATTIEAAVPNDDTPQPNSGKVGVYDVYRPSPQVQQLMLERDHWLLKAEAYRIKAGIKRTFAESQTVRGAISETERGEARADSMLLEADAKEAEAKAIELSQQMASANQGASELREQPSVEPERRKIQIEAEIEKLESILEEFRPSVATEAAKIEFEQLERAMLQRELEQLHAVLMQLNQSEAVDSDGESSDQLQQNLQRQKDVVSAKITSALEKLTAKMKKVAEASAELEGAKRKQLSLERQLDNLEQLTLKLDHPQAATEMSLEERRLRATVAHLELMRDRLERKNVELQRQLPNDLASRPHAQPSSKPVKTVVEPGDLLTIRALNLEPGNPINEDYRVETWGTVALGPTYGRVKAEGLTVLEAEEAIKKHLAEKFENPIVQVTMGRQAEPSVTDRYVASPSQSNIGTRVLTDEQQQEVFAKLHESLAAVQRENAALKKQVEELHKQQPAATSPSIVK